MSASEPVVTPKFAAETPLQRYTSRLQSKIDENLKAKQNLINQEETLKTKIEDAKSQSAGRGSICHNCHMRLRHTSRTCTFDRCETVYSCGQEKFHPAELTKLRQIRQSINKLEKETEQLSSDMENRMTAVSKVNNSITNRIETELLEADDEKTYDENGFRNWQLLRKHVYAIQGYSKKYLHGKIPPKHELKNILELALEESSELTNKTLLPQSKQGRRKHRENPFKGELESRGIVFPSEPESSFDKVSDETELPRYMPMTKEEEEEQLRIALSISEKSNADTSNTSCPTQRQSEIPPARQWQLPESQVLQSPTSSWFYPQTASSYNNFPYFHQMHQPSFYQLPPAVYHQSNTEILAEGSRGTSSCTITSPKLAPNDNSNADGGQMNTSPSIELEDDLNEAQDNLAAELLLRLSSRPK